MDEGDMEIKDIGEGFCWFKARNVKYHIIPDQGEEVIKANGNNEL